MVLLTGHDVAGMMFFLVNASTEKLPCLWRPIWLIELIKLIEFIEFIGVIKLIKLIRLIELIK
jgi:hypothetical protein